MKHTCGAIHFGDENGKRLAIMGSGRRAFFRHMRDNGVLPEGITLLADTGGGVIEAIEFDQIAWETVGDLGKPRHLGGLQEARKKSRNEGILR